MIWLRSSALALILGAACSTSFAQTKRCPAIEEKVSDRKFAVGQVWSYQTRPNEPRSTVTILQIDRLEKIGVVIHIRVDGLQMHNPRGELVPVIEHMPFSRDAMLLSTTQLIRTLGTLPTMEGYDYWRSHCGGVYSISVADAVALNEKTFNHP